MVSIREAPPSVSTHENELLNSPCLFFDHIKRPDLKEVITPSEPWVYTSAEFYGRGIKGQGGLGMLASDTYEVAKKLNLPAIFSTLFYRRERSYDLDGSGKQREIYKEVSPEERGFVKADIHEFISTERDPVVNIDFYTKKEGSVTLLCATEPGIGELYQDKAESDHRMYQNVVLGFGGYKALKALGIKPSMNQQLNEAPTVFSALARLDDYLSQTATKDLREALAEVRKKTIYTNHTLVQAAEPEFTLRQFEHFVLPNIKSEDLKEWLTKKVKGKGNRIRLSTLAIELAGKKNGVSKIHAREASKMYTDYDGNKVEFDSVTNGISIDRWGNPNLLALYRENNILDAYDLPDVAKINLVKEAELIFEKERKKAELRTYLQQREDQYGNPVILEKDAKIANWRRRIANYKRPGLIFTDPEKFARILENENMHYIMAGNVHPADEPMKNELERILSIIDNNEILKKRVHFIKDYDEELGRALAQGADISINTPTVGKEACGTSGMKDMLNDVLVISTEDGWLADPTIKAESEGQAIPESSYLRITGNNEQEEAASLYAKLTKVSRISDGKDDISWGDAVKEQLRAYLPIIAGARMEENYLNLGFPKTPEITIFSSKNN